MIRDITIGQYYPVESVVHRLDPRTKLFGTLIYIISLFFADNLLCYAVATVFLAMAVRASRVPFKFIVRGLKAIVFLLLISISFNLFLTNGRVIFRIGFLKVTHEGLRLAVFMGLRLMYLVIGSSVMTLTTTPNQLTDGLEKSLGCLNRIHVPVHEISMMMSIALRFIPILIEETVGLLASLYSSQVVTKGDKHLLNQNRFYYKMVNQLVDEGQRRGQITRSMPYYEIAHMYALCERAIIYDYCISDGGYALGEYTRKTMPLLFGGVRVKQEVK